MLKYKIPQIVTLTQIKYHIRTIFIKRSDANLLN